MRWTGKLIGAIVGLLVLRHPLGLLIGLLIGHAIDAGWFSRADSGARDRRYAALGVTRDASDDEVERAYRQMISQYHPDKVAGAAEEIRRIAEQRASEINTAYESIRRERRG